ncbi:hypothetical protein [Roseiconus lacunae]|uniref:hypothetical protein n=1 Tax=Roseiconus lacunae TaxID=2605694 RepID=UPI001E4BB027|nr:hypothetical protein [Roseiconus lacunae]MCD0459113.1 hypothetical protein [Roseiconus lacunae]
MSHYVNDDVLDAAANEIKNNCDLAVLCDGEPSSYANATTAMGTGSGQKLAEVAFASGDMTIANGDTSGRKITFVAKASVNVDNPGDGEYIAYLDTSNSKILHHYPIETARNGLLSGDKVNFPTHDLEFRDPTAEA